MKTRLGKIAQLPKSIRDDLNHRLENGKQSPELLDWLNGLAEVQKLITTQFDNQPITKSNLSHWRHGGFLDWQADQIREARIHRICETGGALEKAEAGDLFENFARITVAEMITDVDALQKLRGEKRAERLHHLVRDLARLQNAYNRSRWACLAWTKYNDTLPNQTTDFPTPNSQLQTTTATPSLPAPVAPDCTQSQAMTPDEGEPKPNGNGRYVLHFTDCNCDEPCPKCHAPDSDYPLDDAIRDRRYYRKHGEYPCDRRGKQRFLINVACDCYCDRCADINTGRVALPRDPIIHHAESRDEKPTAEINPTPPFVPPLNLSPLSPISPLRPAPAPTSIPPTQPTDFARRLALLKTASQ